jgi:Phosphotransferase enzyme family
VTHADDPSGDPLTAECRQVLGADLVSVEPLTHSVVGTTTDSVALVRAGGRAAVVKVVAPRSPDPADASRNASSFRWWRREVDLLRSPILSPYREAGIRPPVQLAAVDRGPDRIAIWEEAFEGVRGDAWSIVQFEAAARRLGEAQGASAVSGDGRAPLSRSFLRDYLAEKAPTIPYERLDDAAAWSRPLVRASFPTGLGEPLRRLHADQARLLAWVESGPRTLAHLDVWPLNLFVVGNGFGLVDWAFAGSGSLGEDPGNLVLDAVPDLLRHLDVAVLRGYLDGLNDAGWDGDERLVRLAMCASAVKYDWLAPAMLERADGGSAIGYGGRSVPDAERLFSERARALAFIVERADEARRLAAEIGVG